MKSTAQFDCQIKMKTLSAAISVAVISLASVAASHAQAQAPEPEVEEVLVTGTLIRRTEGFKPASPVTQLSAADLKAEGTANMGEIVQNSTFNLGTGTTQSIQGSSNTSTAFNLKGLGPSATLILMDGMRAPTNNVNLMLPTIAIQRLDILRDGAAQLYGTDAVAGVVNYIPYASYNGFDMEYYQEQDTRGDYRETDFQVITGMDVGENSNFVFAASRRSQGDLRWDERPSLMLSGLTSSANGSPGNFIVPLRDANGQLTGASRALPDPQCSPTRDYPAQPNANPNGFLDSSNNCWFDFGDNRSYRDPYAFTNAYTAYTWDVNEDFSVKAQFNYSRLSGDSRGSLSGGAVNMEGVPDVIRGEHPGNPYRAVTSTGVPLFARDSNGDTLPDRDANGTVILDPNGIPFNEDVRFGRHRIIGKSHPGALDGTGVHNPDTSMIQSMDRRYTRFALTSSFTVPFLTDWEGSSSYAFMSTREMDNQPRLFDKRGLIAGLSCDVLNDRDTCFNPFAPTPGDPSTINSPEVMRSMSSNYETDHEDQLQTFDFVLNGTVSPGGFELPGGAIGAAIGYQRREENSKVRPSAIIVAGHAFNNVQQFPYSVSRDVDSYFMEMSFPVIENLEVSAAVRDESFSTGQGEVVQKYGFAYQPLDWLTLRGTWGEAFIVPTMTQLAAPESCGSATLTDPFSTFAGFTLTCNQGNPALEPEHSETSSLGVDMHFSNELTVSLTWSETDFSNRLVPTNVNDIARIDFANFRAATGFMPTTAQRFPDPNAVLNWQKDPRSDKRIQRNPIDAGDILKVITGTSNAASVIVSSYDMEVGYEMEIRNLGTFRFGVDVSYIEDFLFQKLPTDPVRQGVGAQNDFTGTAPAVPRWKSNASLNWTRENHSATMIVRYVDDMVFDAAQNAYMQNWAYNNWRHVDVINAWTQMDVAYTYRDLEVSGLRGSLDLSIGSRNVFDREAQKSGMSAGAIAELQNPLGRVVYARASYGF